MKHILLLIVFFLFQNIFSQVEEGLVFFADKQNVQQSIDNPISILSQASLDRKALHNIPIDARDVPVNENYIQQVKSQPGITVLSKSKWLNAVYVRGNFSAMEGLLNLSFVTFIEYGNKSLNGVPVYIPVPDKFSEIVIEKADFNYGFAANQIEMVSGEYLHQQGYTGEGMVIAFMDSGYPGVQTIGGFEYMRNNGNLLGTYDFVEKTEEVTVNHSHGTRTLSTAAGYIQDQFVGTAPDASYYLFRTEDTSSEMPVEEAYWLEALERADSLGVHVVNTSLGYREYDNPSYSHTYQDLDGNTTIAARGANIGFEKGMLLVNSAGNSGSGSFPWVSTPGDASGIFTIGAVDGDGNYAGFSSIGPTADGRIKPDVMLQGAAAYNINPDNEINTGSGTSFSSPIAAGLIACLWQSRLYLSNTSIMQYVRESAHLYNNPTNEMGYGIPNFQNALEAVLSVAPYHDTSISVYPNPAQTSFFVKLPSGVSIAPMTIYGILGNKIATHKVVNPLSSIDISNLKKGVYLLYFETEAKTQTIKLIKN